MKTIKFLLAVLFIGGVTLGLPLTTSAVDLNYTGVHANIGGTFFPGGGPADERSYVVVPWRTDGAGNTFSASSEVGERYYGKDGYALFATRFDYPDANDTGPNNGPPIDPDEPFDPFKPGHLFAQTFPNLLDGLPDFVEDSKILASKLVGGYAYSLIDDPRLTAGYRDNNWGDTQSPPAMPVHSQPPYVKLGILDGWDQYGNDPASTDPESLPAGRWGFTVGADPPSNFRVGVMTGGLDNANFAPKEIVLAHVSALGLSTIFDTVSTGSLTDEEYTDRFVDMHFFDITNAQEGDSFAFGVKSTSNNGISPVSGFSFDVLPDVAIVDANFDADGDIDGQDFLTWQRGYGSGTTPEQGDANNDANVDGVDLGVWQSQYGTLTPLSAIAVPEPTSVALLLAAVLWGITKRR